MGAIICYDCTDENSFKSSDSWLTEFRQAARENAPMVLVANKSDLLNDSNGKSVDPERGRKLAESFGAKFIETSAHSGENVDLCFTTICEEILIQRNPKLLEQKYKQSLTLDGTEVAAETTRLELK